ncbi:J domain-containing protein [Synechocystis sp. PCC 7509]|uniref:J domain-containing protein n=1 Tax=Synechocystis sp. PCC 7509 TaxID=927677 RepID=UPI0002ABB8EA|nr:DnaJ domain-containing protein [Synechocystis sp. PCC 7509]
MNSFESWEIEEKLNQLKAQMRNPQAPANPANVKYTPPTSDSKTKKKYLSQEIEEELEQLKAQLRNLQNLTNAKYTPPINNKNKAFCEILEVKSGASQDEIKQAYKRLVKKWHPDLFFNNPKLQL